MDPFSSLSIENDSSVSLIRRGLELGIDIWVAQQNNLTFYDNKLSILANRIKDPKLKVSESKETFVEEFDFFFLRQDPPFNMNFISNCYLLEIHKKLYKKPFFINDPSGIKNFTEKIFPMYFYDLMPKTMVTSNLQSFRMMVKKYKTVVVKPLYDKGGMGIYKITRNDKNTKNIFNKVLRTYRSPVVVQEFIPKVSQGDKRVIIIDGLPMGVINRIPKSGEFKANLHLGGYAKKTNLTKKEKEICHKLKPTLKKNKLFFVGIDLIDEKLTEINVTSPTGINQINEIYNINLQTLIWDKILKLV